MTQHTDKDRQHIATPRWFGVAVTRWSRSSCSTSSPVSTGMGDCLRAGKLSHCL